MGDDKKQNKTIKDALKSVVAPLLIVLRREQKKTNQKLDELKESRPDVQKTEVTNPQKEVEVTNFPKEIKAEITNPQKEVEVKGLIKSLSTLKDSIVKQLTTKTDSIVKSLIESTDEVKTFIKSHTFKVKVENQKEIKFPKVQGVKLSSEDMKILIKGIKQEVQRVQIENSSPGDAIPVVLTNKEKRRFYDLTLQITGGTNMARVVDAIENIEVTIKPGDIQIGAVEVKDDDTDTRLSVEDDGGKNAAYVQSNSLNQETTQLLIKTLLASLDSKDFSTETTLNSLLTAFNAENFATETTLAKIDTAQGAKTDAEATGNGSVIAILKRLRSLLGLFNFTGAGLLKVDAQITATVETDVRTLGQKLAQENKLFMAVLDFLTLGTSNETDVMLLKNPTASGVNLRIREFLFVSSKSSNPTTMRLYRNPTITSDGTAISINNFNDATISPKATAFETPIISARGTLFEIFGLVGQAELRHEEFLQMFIRAGDTLLITLEPNSANQSFAIDLSWGEE